MFFFAAMCAVSILTTAVGTQAPCTTDRHGFCTDKTVFVKLQRSVPNVPLAINTSLGEALTIRFPPGVVFTEKGVTLGNKAAFASEVVGTTLHIRPQIPPGVKIDPQRGMLGEHTNLNIQLRRGYLISIDLMIAHPDDAVRTLIFTSKEIDEEEAYIAQRVKDATTKLRGQIAEERDGLREQAQNLADEDLTFAALKHLHCEDWRKTEMRDLLWVQKTRLCKIGTRIHLHFVLRNEARDDLFQISSVKVLRDGTEEALPVTSVFRLETGARARRDEVALRYGQEVRGAASWEAREGAKSYTLQVTELGGKQRTVTVDGVRF